MTNEDQAITSRITPIETRSTSQKELSKMKDKLLSLDKLILKKAADFRRRIFQLLPLILEDIDFLRSELREIVGTDRKIDQITPMLAAYYALTHDDIGHTKCDPIELMAFVQKHVNTLFESEEQPMNDEDHVITRILSHIEHTITKDNVAGLILTTTSESLKDIEGLRKHADKTLRQIGITIKYGPQDGLIQKNMHRCQLRKNP